MASDKGSPYGLLWDISRGSRALYGMSIVFMLASTFCNFLLPQAVRFVVDCVVGDAPAEGVPLISGLLSLLGSRFSLSALRGNLLPVGILVTGIAVVSGICAFIFRQCLALGAEKMIKKLRDALYTRIQYLPYSWHVASQTGDIVQRCTADVDVVHGFIFIQLIEIARAIAMITLAYAILFPINAVLSVVSIAFLPVILIFSYGFLRGVAKRFLAADEAEGELLSIAQENFTGVRVVRAFGRERYEMDKFGDQNSTLTAIWLRLGDLISIYWALSELLPGLQMVAICTFGAWQAANGSLTVGGFIVFLTYNTMVVWPVRGLGRVLSEASKTGVSLARLREILDAPIESDPPGAVSVPLDGDIVFDQVSFSHNDTKILQNVSFTIKAGTTLGIVGATGSGKTTIAHLLCRLYDLKEGEGTITIGGVDIRSMDRFKLRGEIGIALQEPFLYSRTLSDNIAGLRRSRSQEDVRRAAVIADLDDEINAFPEGYGTIVGERGVTLSGGQKQRVAIARAIVGDPAILIFDDSLSAVDAETDAAIRQGLAKRSQDVTTIIISHRVATVAEADQIIVLERGRIIEQGTPAALSQKPGGVYRRIWEMQQSIGEDLE